MQPAIVPSHRLAEWEATPFGPPLGLPEAELSRALANALDWQDWDYQQRSARMACYLERTGILNPASVAEEVCWRARLYLRGAA